MNDDNLDRWLADQVTAASPLAPPSFEGVAGRHDRLRKRRRAAAVAGTSLAVAGVASVALWAGPGNHRVDTRVATTTPSETSSPTGTARPEPTYTWTNQPPPVVLRLADRDIELDPWTYCWSGPADGTGVSAGMCADGMPGEPDSLPRVTDAPSIDLWFGVEGWTMEATLKPLDQGECTHHFSTTATATGDHTFRLDPMGPAGRYQVDLFVHGGGTSGSGPGGDVATSFVWTTPVDGLIEQPEGYLALVADEDDSYTSYGVELGVSDLAFQPREASATVTVTSANDQSATFEPEREDSRREDCYEAGSLFFSDRDMEAVAARVAALGDGPFSYRVVLTIDGKRYVGTAAWPRDEKKDEAPNTVLTFDPPLPAYTG